MSTDTASMTARSRARVLYESDQEATISTVAGALGVPIKLVREWKAADGWQKAQRRMADLPGRAMEAADAAGTAITDTGPALGDGETDATEEPREVVTAAADAMAIDLRGQVLDRHRREWSGPRKLAYKAFKAAEEGDLAKAFDTGRVAKITAETLTLIQAGERRAHGIGDKDIDMPVFTIERT